MSRVCGLCLAASQRWRLGHQLYQLQQLLSSGLIGTTQTPLRTTPTQPPTSTPPPPQPTPPPPQPTPTPTPTPTPLKIDINTNNIVSTTFNTAAAPSIATATSYNNDDDFINAFVRIRVDEVK
ncbi:hypothetical protein TYRP_005345 [Tyrophagus putrescentiae]|nr:hypothetical protein TYRP_005345 [Tyrophagus putrescentiae]